VTRWLLVSGDFTPLGGMDAANYALARHLAATHDVHLVTHRAWPDLLALPRIAVRSVRRPFGRHALGSLLLARAGQREWRRLQSIGVQVVVNGGNCHLAGAVNWVHYLHAAYAPLVAGSWGRRSKTAFAHRRDLAAERRALRAARLIICNSRRTRADVIERIGVEPARVHVVYYGSDPERFAPVGDAERVAAKAALGARTDRPLVGFVGALGDRRKGFDTVFHAWVALCRDRAWDADLIVVGAGRELRAWQERAAEAGVGDRMRFAGFRRDVPAVVAALDGFVHPARYEAYGLAVHEALCRGVPAIVSATAGVAEQYQRELDDLLVRDVDDPGELAERLSNWRVNLERMRSRVRPLSARLRARTWDGMAREIVASVEASA
jgi:glycosyltransferase involved in cell wall biosynthesis